MFGLGFPQLVLILAGICFMVAGIYGLAPSLVTSRFGGISGLRPSRREQEAQARAEALKLIQLKPQPQIKQEESPAVKAEARVVPMVAKQESAPVATANPAIEAVRPAPAARRETPSIAVVPTPGPELSLNEPVMVDQEFVEELFSEMFALRSTVAGLVNEVKQLRTEQKSRRFIVEEVVA